MGGRLSVPRSADGLTEIPNPTKKRAYGSITPRVGTSSRSSQIPIQVWIQLLTYATYSSQTVTAPLAALTMAALLYVYTRTSIRAAKLNAQKHREADGGQLSWYNEGRRRHGSIEQVEEKGTFKEALLGTDKKAVANKVKPEPVSVVRRHSEEEERLGKLMGKGEK